MYLISKKLLIVKYSYNIATKSKKRNPHWNHELFLKSSHHYKKCCILQRKSASRLRLTFLDRHINYGDYARISNQCGDSCNLIVLGTDEGFSISHAMTLKQIAFIPCSMPAEAVMSPDGDRLYILNRRRPDWRDKNIGEIKIYKFNRRDLNNEMLEDYGALSIKHF